MPKKMLGNHSTKHTNPKITAAQNVAVFYCNSHKIEFFGNDVSVDNPLSFLINFIPARVMFGLLMCSVFRNI